MQQPIHIVHVIYRLSMGGMENGLVNLVNGMDPMFRHHIVSLTDSDEFEQRIKNPDATVTVLNKKPGKDFACYWRLWRCLRQLQPDIVHTRNFGTVDCGLIARLAGIKTLVHSEHGWDMSDLAGGNPKYIRLRRWLAPLAVRWLAVSANIRDWLENTVGVAANKLVHIYNGVDATRFHPAQSTTSTSLHVGFVGRVEQVKNLDSVVRAMSILAEDQTLVRPVTLSIVGSGSVEAALREKVTKAGLDHAITFTGPSSEIPELMRTFNAFVLPSFNEGISNTILEAMASGLPVVATNVGGNPELIDADRTGQLYPSDDASALSACLKRYADNETLRDEHGRAARKKIDELFTLTKMVSAYEQFYLECLNPNNGT